MRKYFKSRAPIIEALPFIADRDPEPGFTILMKGPYNWEHEQKMPNPSGSVEDLPADTDEYDRSEFAALPPFHLGRLLRSGLDALGCIDDGPQTVEASVAHDQLLSRVSIGLAASSLAVGSMMLQS